MCFYYRRIVKSVRSEDEKSNICEQPRPLTSQTADYFQALGTAVQELLIKVFSEISVSINHLSTAV